MVPLAVLLFFGLSASARAQLDFNDPRALEDLVHQAARLAWAKDGGWAEFLKWLSAVLPDCPAPKLPGKGKDKSVGI
ncbi:MAG: hypothetical protein NTY77_02085 [Elusimicrobia bacterium]|nr:hypothetical protein [Elusimicrobiota bacterium]